MGGDGQAQVFDAFVAAHSAALVRFGWILTGSRDAGEDIVQESLLRLWQRWERVELGDPARYVRTIMVNTYATRSRRLWRREVPTDVVPEPRDPATTTGEIRTTFLVALGALPPRQRAVLALRYYVDYTEAQTAEALGCSVGTVKSQTSKALDALRRDPCLASLTEDEEVLR